MQKNWRDLIKPKQLEVDEKSLTPTYGRFVGEPLERGFGTTIGNSLRRILLSSLHGAAITAVRIQDNLQLPANTYIVRIKEIEAGRGDLRPNMILVMDPRGEKITIAGEETVEPTFGLPAMWIDPAMREEAMFRGYTVVDPATVVTTHLTEVVKDNMAELMSYAETQKLVEDLGKEHQKLIGDLIPAQISMSGIQRVLHLGQSNRLMASEQGGGAARNGGAQEFSPRRHLGRI